MRLVPGVTVAPVVIAGIDSNHDGVLSRDEQLSYAYKVLADLQLQDDGRTLPLRLTSFSFPSIDQMKAGSGEIELVYYAALPALAGGEHRFTFENHHQSGISVYLVNSLVPQDRNLQLGAQAAARTSRSAR